MIFDTSRLKALETRCGQLEDELRRLRSYVSDVEDELVHRVEKLLKRAQREAPSPSAAGGNHGSGGAGPAGSQADRRAELQRTILERRRRVSRPS